MKKILLLTDFSAASEHAFHFAKTLFNDVAAHFCLINIFPLNVSTSIETQLVNNTDQERIEISLQERLSNFQHEGFQTYHSYRCEAVPGWPVSSIEAILENEYFDLVVLGATGAGNSEWMGSLATELIRKVKTNVLVVPASTPVQPIKNIVLASDYRIENITAALKPLKELATFKQAELTLLTIEKPTEANLSTTAETQTNVINYLDSVDTHIRYVQADDTLEGINTYLDTHAVDLLVTIPHQKSLLDVLTGRSITRQLAYHSRVPIIALYDSAEPIVRPSSRADVFTSFDNQEQS